MSKDDSQVGRSAEVAGRFGERLRELREAKGMSQQELADRAGLTRDGVAQFETGRRRPMWESVLALMGALGATCQEFIDPPQSRVKAGPGRPSKKSAVPATGSRTPARRKAKGG